MTEEDLLQATKDLIAIPSALPDLDTLHKALNFIADIIWTNCPDATIERFEKNGKPSLLAYRGGQRPARFHVLLNGHVDVVPGKPEQFKAVVKDGKLYGRGAYDMKGASVIMTSVFCEFVNKVPYPLALQIVTDEENAGQDGTLHQIEQGVRADFVICGECGRPTTKHEIANEAKGIVVANIEFKGHAAHSAYPWKGDNAALKAAHFIKALHERYPAPEETDGTVFSVTGMLSDSGAHSKIPDQASVLLTARFIAEDPNFRSKNHFAALMQEIDQNVGRITYRDFTSPIYTNPKNPLLVALKVSAEEVEGAEFSLVRRHGTGDGRFYGDVGDEACEFGIAGEGTHSDNEYITLDAFHNYLETMRHFLERTITAKHNYTPHSHHAKVDA